MCEANVPDCDSTHQVAFFYSLIFCSKNTQHILVCQSLSPQPLFNCVVNTGFNWKGSDSISALFTVHQAIITLANINKLSYP